MEYDIISKSQDLESLKADWERIEKTSETYTYFSSFQYNVNWCKTNSNSKSKLFIIKISQNNKVVGIAPLQISKHKGKLISNNVIEFINAGDYTDFLIDFNAEVKHIKVISKIFDVIQDHRNEWEEINLTNISNNSLLSYYLLSSNYNNKYKITTEVPFINFNIYNSLDEYRKLFLPRKVKQYVNKLRREVNVELKVTRKNVIDDISKIHISEKEYLLKKGIKNRRSIFDNQDKYHFLKELYTENENVLTYILINKDEGDEIVCYYTGFVFNGRFHSYNTAYNPKYERFSVGKIFNSLIFEANEKENLWDVFDMGAGRYAWKFEWTNTYNMLYELNYENYKTKKMKFLSKIEKILSTTKHILKN